MRVATVDGLVTLFYDGSKELYNESLEREIFYQALGISWENFLLFIESSTQLSNECKEYFRERLSWEQVIIVDGVTEIPNDTFYRCFNIKRVIFADSVIKIKKDAFFLCKKLVFIKWSLSLLSIGTRAFCRCNLSSVFIPPLCRLICDEAFESNENLSILHVPQNTDLRGKIFNGTALAEVSPINDDYIMNRWLKNLNNNDQFSLHRACSSFQPLKEVINAIVQEKGLNAFTKENSAGITPSRYLQENPSTDLSEKEIIHDYLIKMTGEVE